MHALVTFMHPHTVYPWVLSDYTSSSLDLSNESVYRDLSKPIGALNPSRLEYFKHRLQNMPDAGLYILCA